MSGSNKASRHELPLRDDIAALERVGGDQELAREFLATLLAQLPQEIEDLRACVSEADWGGLSEYTREIRQAVSYCAVPALHDAVAALERAAQAGDAQRAGPALEQVEQQAQLLRQQINR